MLTADQREDFHRNGLLWLPAAIDADDAERMRDRLWDHLRQDHGARPDRPDTWPAGALAHFQSLTRPGAFDALASPPVLAAIDALLGPRACREPEQWGRPLVTFPEGAPWRLPYRGWHRDSSDRPGDPVLVVFGCLAPVEARGGGTLVVTGSHQLTAPEGRYGGLRSARVRERLAADHLWFRDLFTPGAEPQRTERLLGSTYLADGSPVQIAELTGDRGDVILMHPRSLHAVAPNALGTPRLMLLHFVERA
jgi:Phytanoyl-CoA dioxygenase (PhyH)